MKIDRTLGVLLSILVVIIILIYNNSIESLNNQDSFGLIGDSGVLSDGVVSYNSQEYDENNTKNAELIEFVNKENYPVTINSNEVSIKCEGSTAKENEIVKNNYKIYATFSNDKSSEKYEYLRVLPKEKIYIHINTSYEGDTFPTNDVTCNYSINIEASV